MVYQNRKQHRKERAQCEGKRGKQRRAALDKRLRMAATCLTDHEEPIDMDVKNMDVKEQEWCRRKRGKRQTRMRLASRELKGHEWREQLYQFDMDVDYDKCIMEQKYTGLNVPKLLRTAARLGARVQLGAQKRNRKDDSKHTLVLCLKLCEEGRAAAIDSLMAGLVSFPLEVQRQIISTIPTATPFVPGIYIATAFYSCYQRVKSVEILVISPGMKTARMEAFEGRRHYDAQAGIFCFPSPEGIEHDTRSRLHACIGGFIDRLEKPHGVTPPEDYAVLVDYALDESLVVYQARINGNNVVIDQHDHHLGSCVATAVMSSREEKADDSGISDWLIRFNYDMDCGCGCTDVDFHLLVRL
jgi:hypothetical protein